LLYFQPLNLTFNHEEIICHPQSTAHNPTHKQGTSKRRIWKHWVRWLGWAGVIGHAWVSPAYAACNLIDAGSPNNSRGWSCACSSAGTGVEFGRWNVNFGSQDGSLIANSVSDATMCSNGSDTTCSITTPPNTVTNGSTLYFKASDGTHFKCNVTFGSDLVSEYYTPTTPPPVSAPLFDLNHPTVIYSEEIDVTE